MGVTSPSTSRYASTIIMVKKMDGYRVCVDFKNLNKITQALDAFTLFLRISGLRVNIEKNKYHAMGGHSADMENIKHLGFLGLMVL